nr:protein HEAT INTOLERANT 4-like [Ipomoea batatas]
MSSPIAAVAEPNPLPSAEQKPSPSLPPAEDLWQQVFTVGTKWDQLDMVYQYKWNFSNLEHRKEVAEHISSSMATKKIMPDQIKGEIPPTSSSWKTTYLQTNLSFPSFIALLFLKVDNSLARQYTPVLECKRNSEG